MNKIILLANQKGGVAKTTLVANVGDQLPGKKLIVDVDPQASLTDMFGIQPKASMYHVLGDSKAGSQSIESIIVPIAPNLDLAPSDVDLALSETGLIIGQKRWEYLLQKALEPVRSKYDWIVIDSPPNLGALTTCGIMAADEVVVPTQLTAMAIKGMNLFLKTLRATQADYGSDAAQLRGVVCTLTDIRLVVAREMLAALQAREDLQLFETLIPKLVAFEEASLMGQTIQQYAPNSDAAKSIATLTKEIING